MLPKKSRTFIKPAAEQLGFDSQFVDDVTDFYWKEVRKAAGDLVAPVINVANFGSFRIKESKLEEQKRRYKLYLDTIDASKMTFLKHKAKADVEQRVEQIEKMIDMVSEDMKKKKEVRQKRNERRNQSNS